MMRRNRGNLLNFGAFLIALSLILFLNLPSKQSHKPFAWDRVRYESHDVSPPSRGVCRGVSATTSKPVLVVARTDAEPLSALESLSSLYHICAYTADAVPDPKSVYLQTPANRGHEGMAYLTFIIDNYDKLPPTGMVFVHGSRFSWHNDDPSYDNVSLLSQLNVSRALYGPPGPATGYWNLRCDWSASTCDTKSADAKPQGSFETAMRAALEPGNKRIISDAALGGALESIFGKTQPNARAGEEDAKTKLRTALGRSDAVRSQCCAQFVVARENIWGHTRDEYVALRQWLLDGSESTVRVTDPEGDSDESARDSRGQQRPNVQSGSRRFQTINSAAPADDLVAGRILSYLWHILFLNPHQAGLQNELKVRHLASSDTSEAVVGVDLNTLNVLACPRADECYCRLYGRCDLKGCDTPGRCRGQYRIPPNFKLPKDWADTHQ